MFLSPGVTPWETTLPGVKNGANNPGIRIFEYDDATLVVQVRHNALRRGVKRVAVALRLEVRRGRESASGGHGLALANYLLVVFRESAHPSPGAKPTNEPTLHVRAA